MKIPLRVLSAAFIVLICGLTSEVRSQGRVGFGIIVGEPTGVAFKYRMNSVNAVDGALGFSPFDRFRLHADYLWHTYPFEEDRLAVHYGFGAAIGFGRTDYIAVNPGNGYVLRSRELGFGVRGVLGLTYAIPRSIVDLFLEVAPVLVVTPDAGMGIDAGIGARVYP